MDIAGKTALVTGGAVRVGRAISLALSGAGMRVLIHCNSSLNEGEALRDEIRIAGGGAEVIQADLADPDGIRALALAAADHGPVDVLVNNASVFPPEPFADVTEEVWEMAIGVNLRAPFFLTQALGGAMKAGRGGVVINLADLAGIQAWRGYAAHGISKAGVVHLTRIAARALAPEVRVVGIAPGTVLPPDDLPPDVIADLEQRAPLKSNGSPEDVTRTILFLLASDFITGQTLTVDGGRAIV